MVSFIYSKGKFAPDVSTKTAPRQKNCVPMVTTSEGMPNFTTMKPLIQPIIVPANRAAIIARNARMPTLPIKAVSLYTKENATMPMAMIDGKERSLSFAITTIVRGMAMMAKKGIEDMKAEYICGDKKVSGAETINMIHKVTKTPKIPSWALFVRANLRRLKATL